MNIHFPQVERRSQLSSHILTTFAVFMALILMLSLFSHVKLHWSVPSISIQSAQIKNSDVPVAVPAPLPPVAQPPAIVTPEAVGNATSIFVPQAIPAPAPFVP